MNNFFKILTLAFLTLSFSGEAFSQAKQVRYSRTQPSIVTEIQKRSQIIQSKLIFETDPEKRKELIRKQRQLNDLYYNSQVKHEIAKSISPEFVKRADEKATRAPTLQEINDSTVPQSTASPEITMFSAYSKDWDSFPAEQKIKFCKQMKKECDNGKSMEYCRFVVVKCKSYLEEGDYQKLIDKYSKRPK